MHQNAEPFQYQSLQNRTPLQRSDHGQHDEDSTTPLQRSAPRCVPANHFEVSGAAIEQQNSRAASPIRLTTKRKNSYDGFFRPHEYSIGHWPDESSCLDCLQESSYWDWRWEIMSMASSLGLLGGVCLTLARYHHGQQPQWPFNININSLVSVLTTVLIAQLGFILAELISQLKWSWFKKPRPLQDLEHYDSASRGLLGAFAFLCRFIRRPQAYLAVGAGFIVLMSAAIGPFTQQSIKPYTCKQPLHNVSASIAAARYVGFEPVVGRWHTISEHPYPSIEMMIAVLEGMVGSENNSKTVPFHCITGDCDFSTYSSLGYCSSCVDLSHEVQEQPTTRESNSTILGWTYYTDWTYTIPGKVCQLRSEDKTGRETPLMPTEAAGPSTTRFVICYEEEDWENGSITFTIISICSSNLIHSVYDAINNTGDGRPHCPEHPEQLSSLGDSSGLVAMSCTLGLCARDYTSHVRNGVLSETTTSLASHMIDTSGYHFKLLRLPCMVGSYKYDLTNITEACNNHGVLSATVYLHGQNLEVPNSCVFRTDHRVPSAIGKFLQSGLFQPHGAQIGGTGTCSWDMNSNSSVCNPWYLEPFVHGARTNAHVISSIMDNITIAISNKMRATSSVFDPRDNFAPGIVNQTTVCLRVDWPWLLMPAALVLITAMLLVVVLHKARQSHILDGQPIWKSSALAALFHGIYSRPRTRSCTDGNIACAPNPTQGLEIPAVVAEEENHRPMSLQSMQARAEKLMVRLQTAATGPGGFFVIKEEEDDDRVLLPRSMDSDSPSPLHVGQTPSTFHRPGGDSAHGQSPMY